MKNHFPQYASSAPVGNSAWMASSVSGRSWLEEDGGCLQPLVHMTMCWTRCLATLTSHVTPFRFPSFPLTSLTLPSPPLLCPLFLSFAPNTVKSGDKVVNGSAIHGV